VSTLFDEIREVADQYPDSRSAILPALQLAQERHGGWLPPEAFGEVGDALGLTPAYCLSIASFYDMFNLAPVGRHEIKVCTNVSCALAGAQQVLESLAAELGCPPGGTSDDGAFTLGTIECLRLDRRALPPAREGRRRARDRRGAPRPWLARRSSSQARTSST
jgi:NADH:ubiquinone oxidoreductase subunit E